jgi:hypothetical protein
MLGKSKWAGLTYAGWQGIRLDGLVAAVFETFTFGLPLEPGLAPYRWRCSYQRPTSMGSIGILL